MQFSEIPETGTPRTMILFGDVITIRHTKPSDMLRRGLNVWLVLGPDTRIIFTLLFITIFLSIFLVVVELSPAKQIAGLSLKCAGDYRPR